MRLSRHYKVLQASSILESVISITIISICAMVAFLIYTNILKHNKSVALYNAEQQVKQLIVETKINKDHKNEVFEYLNYTIYKEVRLMPNDQVYTIHWKIETVNDTVYKTSIAPVYER